MWRTFFAIPIILVASFASAQQHSPQPPQYVPARIISVSQDETTAVISVGEYGNAREVTFEIGQTKKFWAQSPYLVQSGLYVAGHRGGTSVFWYHRGEGGATSSITQLRLVQNLEFGEPQ